MESTGLTKEKVEAFVNEKWPGILKSLEGKTRPHLTRLHQNWQPITCLAKHILKWALSFKA